ncbi:MAG: Stp1/IreP family PP2C-type Ser/Thr phosphatase [Acidobacteria bacterium]|nr:Stp1/IreP family PP2C-type Ser/Thr phosphatase [Acidobacteriota bacterium]
MRSSNEDSFIANPRNAVFLVADGMGGHAAGEIASQIAASTVEEVFSNNTSSLGMEELLRLAVDKANIKVYETQKLKPECRGMGSTLTILTFLDNHYYVAQVGDSRAYLYRNKALNQLTRDHSLVWPLFEGGILTKDDISRHPQKNLITRSIGTQPQVEADLQKGPALEGDIFLLCSDGLTDVLSDRDIYHVLSNTGKSPQELSEMFVKAANSGGGPDNVTTVVVYLAPE